MDIIITWNVKDKLLCSINGSLIFLKSYKNGTVSRVLRMRFIFMSHAKVTLFICFHIVSDKFAAYK